VSFITMNCKSCGAKCSRRNSMQIVSVARYEIGFLSISIQKPRSSVFESASTIIIYYYYYYRISHFSALTVKYSVYVCMYVYVRVYVVINRIRLGGLICSLKSFLQLNMCQELQIFAVVYMYSGAG